MKLNTKHSNFFGLKVAITANFVGATVEKSFITDPNYTKSDDYKKKNPLGQIPSLETADGIIYQSSSILRFLARTDPAKGLLGKNDFEEGLVNQWLDFASTQLDPLVMTLGAPVAGWVVYDPNRAKSAWSNLNQSLRYVENALKATGFLVGSQLTLADISTALVLLHPFRFLFEEKFRKNIPTLTKWFEKLVALPEFEKELGKVRLCVQEFPIPAISAAKDTKPAAAGEKKGGDNKPQGEKKPAGEKKKEEHKKKEEPKKKEKKEKESDDEKDEPSAKKEKNPLDLLPPSTFNLYDFKTLIVNAEDKKEAAKFFWENFDPQGYSLWFVKYSKVEGECEKLYLTNNLMNGMIQRLDSFRKYSFAAHGAYGDEGNYEIRGAWVWRGTEIPAEVKDLPMYDYYTWTRLDHTNAGQKQTFEDYWVGLADGTVVDGLPARNVTYFK